MTEPERETFRQRHGLKLLVAWGLLATIVFPLGAIYVGHQADDSAGNASSAAVAAARASTKSASAANAAASAANNASLAVNNASAAATAASRTSKSNETLLQQGHTILEQIKGAQAAHYGTIQAIQDAEDQIEILAAEIKSDEHEQASGNATVSQILNEAGQAVKELELQEALILQLQEEECTAVGCKAPH